MLEAKELLNVGDELNLYLVANWLRPAITLDVDPIYTKGFREMLSALGVKYKDFERVDVTASCDSKSNGEIYKVQEFYIGSNQENLERLLSAKGNEDFGRALGFPEEAVKAFQRIIGGERRNGYYITVSLARAKKAGLELPTWLAYISFVPENLDLVNGNVSPTSEALGRKYQDFVRKNNPELARRVERDFPHFKMPDSWTLLPGGGYNFSFKSLPIQKE